MCAGKLRLFDNLVREREEIVGQIEAKRLGGLEVDHPYFVGACTGKFTLAPDQRAA